MAVEPLCDMELLQFSERQLSVTVMDFQLREFAFSVAGEWRRLRCAAAAERLRSERVALTGRQSKAEVEACSLCPRVS